MTPIRNLRKNSNGTALFSFLFALYTFIGCVAINILLELNYYPVAKRGFFCNDNSIKYPYKEESISGKMNLFIHDVASIITYLIGEWNCTSDNKKARRKDGMTTPKSVVGNNSWYVRAIQLFMMSVWCSAVTMALTSIIKTQVGWLRPNFLAVCNPNVTCNANNTQLNEDYVCLGTKLFGDWKRMNDNEMRGTNQAMRSFPSGHASYSASFASFAILYIEKRMKLSNEFVLLKPSIQLIWVGISAFVAFSRVREYYHHLQDVIFGAFLGSFVSFLAGRCCMKWLINSSTDRSGISYKIYLANNKAKVNKYV